MRTLHDKQAGLWEKRKAWSLQSSLQVAAEQLFWTCLTALKPLLLGFYFGLFLTCS